MKGSTDRDRPTVLVAEHLAIVGMWLEDVLTDAGYAVDGPHPTCDAATAALQMNRPDYAVVSIDLRQGPCFALACALRRADVPFMLFSGSRPVLPAFRDVPVIERPCFDEDFVACLPRAVRAQEAHRRQVPTCPRTALFAASSALALDQCPDACGA